MKPSNEEFEQFTRTATKALLIWSATKIIACGDNKSVAYSESVKFISSQFKEAK